MGRMFDLSSYHLVVLGMAAALLVAAALNDAHRYRIPNMVCLALLALFPLYVATAPHEVEWERHLIVFGLVLAAGFGMYAKNIAGAGDVKLLAITGLWAGPHLVALFLCVTALAGGLLGIAVAAITYRRNLARGARQAVALARVPIPYGVAIAVGGLCTLVMLSHPVLFSV
jgi:prepilin peptidase CpaA